MRPALCASALLAWLAAPALAQSRRPVGEEWAQVRPLFGLVEAVAGGAPAPADVEFSWQCHFINADAGVVLVPFTLDVKRGAFTSAPVAMYVRVVLRGAPAPAPGPTDALAQYPFEDAAIFHGPIGNRLSRAFTAPPGAYDVYVAIRDTPADAAGAAKSVVVKQQVDIPDLKSDLSTSSIIVVEDIAPDPSPVRSSYEEQLDDPFRLWGNRLTPATRRVFRANESLSVLFAVYQAQPGSDGKPDVEVDYALHGRAPGTDDAILARVRPELFNASTLPTGFNVAGGDVILAGRQIPLATLDAGTYRLEIIVTDKVARRSIRRMVPFSVTAVP